ncbi:DUF6431 domain-containing protein [Candidatus Mycobacterium methanotrophicum]|uniref:DUF6431 domain-containing protein n=1 Tax=Candidatus Mycobacterium methanotrophicum TaxID=2943498 RepID=A0ABY4QNE3_9MYCO|nr:DUF6431 domain-containing protein [Candidatus Mycobacterium methanotrophicum]UQX11304.1 DUF6431 domain-containing protein [Candidatus Mycobacterium methanotrophicum]
MVARTAELVEDNLAAGTLRCPRCDGRLAKWGFGRRRTIRSHGNATVTLRPRRVRCPDCESTHIVLPAAFQARRAGTTAVTGDALLHKAKGFGYRRITARLHRPESTVRRWLRRAAPAHLQWIFERGVQRLVEVAPDPSTELQLVGNQLLTPYRCSARPPAGTATGSGLPTRLGRWSASAPSAGCSPLQADCITSPGESTPGWSRRAYPSCSPVDPDRRTVRRHQQRRIMASSLPRPRHLAEDRVTLTTNGQIFVAVFNDGIVVIESAAQQLMAGIHPDRPSRLLSQRGAYTSVRHRNRLA